MFGTLSIPRPLTTTSALNRSPDAAVRCQSWSLPFHRASVTAVPVRTWGSDADRSVHRSR